MSGDAIRDRIRGALIGLAYDGTIIPLTLGYLVLSLLSFSVIAITEPRRLFGRLDRVTPQ